MLHDSMMAALTSAEKLLFGQPNLPRRAVLSMAVGG